MRYYPTFVDMQGQTVVYLGGGSELANKIRLLSKTPATLVVYGAHISDDLTALVSQNKATWVEREAALEDLDGARLIYVACDDEDARPDYIALAKQSGALVNVVDVTEACEFITPALVERAPLTIAISSDSAAPALSRHVKASLEQSLPSDLGNIGALVDAARLELKAAFPDTDDRRRFLDKLFSGLFGNVETSAHLQGLIETHKDAPRPVGRIAIVGAGPGDPELLTIKAHRALQQADVIVHDKLVSDSILDLARRDAQRIYVGKSRANHTMQQEDISQLLVTLARQGKYVVRLKGGDPFIFGRGGEELDKAVAAGVEVDVVPGVSAALGCAAANGIPLTHRDHASAVSFVAGQRKDLAQQDWHGLAGPGRTLVVYMGLNAAGDIAKKLSADGVRASLPVAIIENGTRPDSRTIRSDLSTMAEDIERFEVQSPALLIIGDVAAEDRAAQLEQTLAEVVQLQAVGAGQ
ncbi:MAG: siroheme synthase CysG [Sphingomonadales bacterium]